MIKISITSRFPGIVRTGLSLSALALGAMTQVAYAQITVSTPSQISVVNGDTSLSPDNDSFDIAVPPNGDFMVFESAAANLVDNDTNNGRDIFQFRRSDKKVTRLSLTSSGQETAIEGDDTAPQCSEPAVSSVLPDGTYGVAFISNATNLSQEEGYDNTSLYNQVYLRIPSLSKTILISRGVDGKSAGNGDSQNPYVVAIAGPNRFTVAFASKATNLIAPAGESESINYIIYMADVSISTSGKISVKIEDSSRINQDNDPTGDYYHPVLSGDGRYMAFVSDASDVIPGQQISGTQVYRFDRSTKTPILLSKATDGSAGVNPSFSPSMTFKGDLVSFSTEASNLGIEASASLPKFALWNEATGSLSLINKNASGAPSNGVNFSENYYPSCSLSSDGKFAIFTDPGDNLVSNDTNQLVDVFVKDLAKGTVLRVSTDANGGQLTSDSIFPQIGALSFNSTGAILAFQSRDVNLGTAPDGDQPNGDNYNRAFFSVLSVPPPPLEKNVVIDIPPDVKVTKQDITLTLKLFSSASAALTLKSEQIETAAAVQSKATKVQWEVQIAKSGSKLRINKIFDRNKATIKKLAAGTYKVKYRVLSKLTSKKTIASKFSPQATFVIK